MMGTPFKTDLSWLAKDKARVRNHLLRYFTPLSEYQDDGQHFTGRLFEWYVERSDRRRFTESDILAVQRLSVTVAPKAAVELVEDSEQAFSRLLKRCHALISDAKDLRDLPDSALLSSAFVELYDRLKGFQNVGHVTASKLLAAKFPAFIPVRDSLVSQYVGAGRSWWRPMKALLASEGVADSLAAVEIDGPRVELLRRLDVALWMEARSK
jgi:hypothetical protein